MPVRRYYSDQPLAENETIPLLGSELHHLTNVMRAKPGASIEVVNGRGELAFAIVESIDKKRALLQIEKVEIQPAPAEEIILAQAIPRLNRLDFILEKGTELGMTQIWLYPSALSERKKLTDQQKSRMQNITIAAMKQSGRLHLPKIKILPPFTQWKEFPENSYFGDLDPGAPPLRQEYKKSATTALFIGPESGYIDKEIDFLKNKGCHGVKLHPNILRTDTAALVALALVTHLSIPC